MVDVGQVISGKYKLLRLLGDGGMGSVYEGEHLVLGTHVAIKVLHGDLARRAGLIDRFLQEARVSAQIRSPHVVHVTDVDRTPEGVAYLVMELLQGEPLSNVLKRERKLGVGTASEYALQILEALEAAHALGVIHRDLKPDNVFVTFEGGKPVLKLIDFGIAKLKRSEGTPGQTKNLTVAGMLMGTPEYMAPEQAYSADKVDVRADLYAVGVMLYEMLSGQPPVSGEDPRVVVLKVERGEVTPLVHAAPGVEPQLAGLVHRAMAPRPELRFANATEMRLALESVMAGKRLPTAQLAQAAPAAQVSAVSPEGSTARAPLAEQPAGTGTVMGAPAAAALNAPVNGMGPQVLGAPPGTGTVRAAPIDAGAMHAQMQAMPTPPPFEPTRPPPRRSGAGLIVGLAVVALLLGAGAVVAYVMGTQSTVATPDPFATSTVTTAEPPSTSTTPTTADTSTSTAPLSTSKPLTPPPPQPHAPAQPSKPAHAPSAAPSGSAAPPPSNTAPTPPPFVIPSTFPSGFPSAFPSAIPLPSGFQLPSGLPPLQWPPPPQQSPPSQPTGP